MVADVVWGCDELGGRVAQPDECLVRPFLFYDAFIFTAVISAFEDGETRLDRNDSIGVVSDPSPKPRALAILNAVAIDDFVDLIGIGSKGPCHFGDVVDRGRGRNHFASDEDPK